MPGHCILVLAVVCAWALGGCASSARVDSVESPDLPSRAGLLSPESPVTSLSNGSTIRGFEFEPCHPECTSLIVYWSEPDSSVPRRSGALRAGDSFGEGGAFVVETVQIVPRAMGNPKTGMAALLIEEATIRPRDGGARYVLTADGVRNFVRKGE
jgi:hypothetical protein